jgi:hypothetical protein
MKLTLEKSDLISILEKHFDVKLKAENVVVRPDPLEIEVSGIPLVEVDAPRPSNVVELPERQKTAMSEDAATVYDGKEIVAARDDPDATTEAPPYDPDEVGHQEAADLHPAAIIEESKRLAAELDKKNPNLAKRAPRGGSHKPPGDFKDEV